MRINVQTMVKIAAIEGRTWAKVPTTVVIDNTSPIVLAAWLLSTMAGTYGLKGFLAKKHLRESQPEREYPSKPADMLPKRPDPLAHHLPVSNHTQTEAYFVQREHALIQHPNQGQVLQKHRFYIRHQSWRFLMQSN
jgi:hypothetical protein